jgi:hypothetical protein
MYKRRKTQGYNNKEQCVSDGVKSPLRKITCSLSLESLLSDRLWKQCSESAIRGLTTLGSKM